MKIARFDDRRIGYVTDGGISDVTAAVEQFMEHEEGAMAGDPLVSALPQVVASPFAHLTAASRPVAELRLLSPVAQPTKILAAPDNYRSHAAEMGSDPSASFGRTARPLADAGLFLKANSSLCGPSAGIAVRFPERRTDYEIELVAVIGKTGTDVSRAAALDYVAGYTIGLDITVRGPEERSFRKSLDGYSVVGPWLVTADEIPDPSRLELVLKQNGIVRQRADTAELINDVPALVAYASTFCTLYPGDLLFTGTPAGVGPIRAGDVLEAQITNIGTMTVRVRSHAENVNGTKEVTL